MSHITSFLALKATDQAVVLQLRRNPLEGNQNEAGSHSTEGAWECCESAEDGHAPRLAAGKGEAGG